MSQKRAATPTLPTAHIDVNNPTTINNDDVVRLRPYQYVHIHDANKNVTRLLVGPMTYTRLEHEHFCSQPEAFVAIPPNNYCIIENPFQRDAKSGEPVSLPTGQVKNRFGYKEVRMSIPPFPLYPGEVMFQPVTPLQVLTALEALRVTAIASHVDGIDGKTQRIAGDEWIIRGPVTVTPHVDVQIVEKISAVSVSESSCLILKAERDFTDREGVKRTAGEQWLFSTPGSFIRDIEETIVGKQEAIILTDQIAIHVRAVRDFTDRFKVKRQTGQEWLVTVQMCSTFVPTPDEKVINKAVSLTVLTKEQYTVVLNPLIGDSIRYGTKQLRQGPSSFFLHPAETLESGVKNEQVLGKDEGLVLYANAPFVDNGKERAAGDKWMITGPISYIPPVEVKIVDRRKAIPLDQNEGVYIRNIATGKVRAHIGKTVLLDENEELWNKELPALVEDLLTRNRYTKHLKATDVGDSATRAPRLKHKVVTANVPHNHFVQVYNFESKKARVVRGPELVTLGPDEEFTVVSLSGGTPKQSDIIKTLCLFSGPDFATDKIIVETRDHARLKLHLSYNWEFDLSVPGIESKIFNVPDFVGDCCKAIASKIRSAVAGEPFDQFHLHSNKIINDAIFGEIEEAQEDEETDEEGERSNVVAPRKNQRLNFEANGLIVTNVDIHSVDPVDQKTSEALTKSVQLAIEITTSSQEADARHHALSLEQAAKGKLERSIIEDKCKAEKTVQELMQLECDNAVIEAIGSSKAESQARADAIKIECETEVEVAKKRIEAASIVSQVELDIYKQRRELELTHKKNMIQLEINKIRGLALIEAEKFKKIIAAIGKDTIKNIAKAGPETQAKLLKGLGLQGYLVTDGSNPINLFNAARGMTAGPTTTAH